MTATCSTSWKRHQVEGKIVVGVADLAVTADREATLITHALGSCIGVTVYDPIAGVGGMLHFMLPNSKLGRDKADMNPAMFADTGIPLLFKECYRLGAAKHRIMVCAAGAAEVIDEISVTFPGGDVVSFTQDLEIDTRLWLYQDGSLHSGYPSSLP